MQITIYVNSLICGVVTPIVLYLRYMHSKERPKHENETNVKPTTHIFISLSPSYQWHLWCIYLSLHNNCVSWFYNWVQPSDVMRLQIWHGGWWLTNPHHHTSQHASVIDSSWRPDLTKVSTTTTAQEELCTANREAYVSTQGHRLAHTESISPMKHHVHEQ